ncbi:hypothetical protein FLL45_04785 [Aliikangiella marina]|uniref:Uncharacterized protein n=1 Tax=Aliikangiella marina TaxID=1712262 RepID=A0A545TJ50_9GAMM|nr:hypothetical protein [Aliikangiella marina]TQV77264.1 hypothetical protein FLL45_04785 [Aliikangiella marina]
MSLIRFDSFFSLSDAKIKKTDARLVESDIIEKGRKFCLLSFKQASVCKMKDKWRYISASG